MTKLFTRLAAIMPEVQAAHAAYEHAMQKSRDRGGWIEEEERRERAAIMAYNRVLNRALRAVDRDVQHLNGKGKIVALHVSRTPDRELHISKDRRSPLPTLERWVERDNFT